MTSHSNQKEKETFVEQNNGNDPLTKQELRDRLRKKIRDKRQSENVSSSPALKKDMQTMLLSMGVDDPSLLSVASQMSSMPHEIQKLKKTLREASSMRRDAVDAVESASMNPSEVQHENAAEEDDDEEELPPN